jgi:hypothetical protein
MVETGFQEKIRKSSDYLQKRVADFKRSYYSSSEASCFISSKVRS